MEDHTFPRKPYKTNGNAGMLINLTINRYTARLEIKFFSDFYQSNLRFFWKTNSYFRTFNQQNISTVKPGRQQKGIFLNTFSETTFSDQNKCSISGFSGALRTPISLITLGFIRVLGRRGCFFARRASRAGIDQKVITGVFIRKCFQQSIPAAAK